MQSRRPKRTIADRYGRGERLTHEQARALWASGTDSDMNRLWRSNIGIAASVAQRYSGRLDFDDALQEAMLGVWLALRSWDPDGGCSLSTYAWRGAERRVIAMLIADTPLHCGHETSLRAHRAGKTRDRLDARGEPSDAGAIAEEMGITRRQASEALALSDAHLCSSLPDGTPSLDLVASQSPTPYDYCVAGDIVAAVEAVTDHDHAHESAIARDIFLADDPATYSEIAGRLRRSKQAVNLHGVALRRRIRARLGSGVAA